MTKFIFDVDGTLTPSRSHIDIEFGAWFHRFCETHEVYIVTGGTRNDTVSQIGEPIYHKCKRVYQCSGNDVWEGDRHIRSNTIELTEDMLEFLQYQFDGSDFKMFNEDSQIEMRPGLINFSIVGKPCSPVQRVAYIVHDSKTGERQRIAKEFNDKFNFEGFEATIAGDTGIDITRMGNGKEQIIQDFIPKDELVFFADNVELGGNDYTLAQVIHKTYAVKEWRETWEILKGL